MADIEERKKQLAFKTKAVETATEPSSRAKWKAEAHPKGGFGMARTQSKPPIQAGGRSTDSGFSNAGTIDLLLR